ncbi:MAG: hypothetical protein HY830_09005 [Actinobacteria bacterium]|nr:hypothetical protein [Actinomycetota bacterium]
MSRRPTFRTRLAALTAAAVTLAGGALVAAPAEAVTIDCGVRTTAQSFARWGDTNQYFVVQDGRFESGAASWALTGGSGTVLGGETFNAVAGTNLRSLWVPALGTATSPTTCVASNEDSLRFFYKAPGIPFSTLHVSIRVTSGVNVATNDLDIDGSRLGWAPSQRIMLPDIRDASGRQYVTVTFSQRGLPASWNVDDVQIDPWRSL